MLKAMMASIGICLAVGLLTWAAVYFSVEHERELFRKDCAFVGGEPLTYPSGRVACKTGGV